MSIVFGYHFTLIGVTLEETLRFILEQVVFLFVLSRLGAQCRTTPIGSEVAKLGS